MQNPAKHLTSDPESNQSINKRDRPYRPPAQPEVTNQTSQGDEQLGCEFDEIGDGEADADLSQSLLSLNKMISKYMAAPTQ